MTAQQTKRLRALAARRFLAVVALAGLTVLGGCGDKQTAISLDEFVAMQRQSEAASPAPVQPGEVAEINRQMGPLRLGPDDVIAVSVSSGDGKVIMPLAEVRISTPGTAMLPMAGAVQVGGMTLEEAESAIRQAYVPAYMADALVLVRLVEPRTTNVVVQGAVGAPGLVPLPRGGRNVLYAVAAAGGTLPNASGRVTLRRIRQSERPKVYDLHLVEDVREALAAQPLEGGDVITVHGAMPNVIFVNGLVNLPGRQEYPPGARPTLLQVIAGAGGLHQYVFPRRAMLTRRVHGEDVRVRVNLPALRSGREPNIELAAGDILEVPHTHHTRVLEFLNRNLFFRAGATATYRTASSTLRGDEKGAESTTIITPSGP